MHQYATGVSSHYRWQRFDAFTIEDNEPEWRVVEHWLKDGKRCLEHTELTYDLAQRTLTTVETGVKPLSVAGMNNSKLSNTPMH
ncbi:hypothetical protein IC611_10530 [Proteus mirabilis]